MSLCISKYKCGKDAGWFRRICGKCRERVEKEQLTEIRKTKPLYHKSIKAIISFIEYGFLGIGCSTITRLARGYVVDETEKTVHVLFEPHFEDLMYIDVLKKDIVEIEDD